MDDTIKTVTVQDVVYKKILSDIVSGNMPPGHRFTMASIAERFNVSIMPIREALMRLEAARLVAIDRNRRIAVGKLSPLKLKNILEARLLNECYLAEKASRKRNEESIKEIEDIFEEIAKTEDIEMYLKLNKEFHFTIYRQAESPVIIELIRPLWERVSPYLHILFRDDSNWNAPEWTRNHEGILDGMKRKDPGTVRYWLEIDLTMASDYVSSLLEE
jgi:DNA-binding GntR family transcriptional regulator